MNFEFFVKKNSVENSAKIIKEAGFTVADYTPNLLSEDWLQDTKNSIKIFEKENLKVHQTHGPYNRYKKYGDMYKECLDRVFEASIMLGADYLVVHGDEFDFKNLEYTPQKALEYNYELFAPIVEKAEKTNLKIAFETVFEDMGVPRFCSEAEDLKALIEKFNTDTVCCCWDFGHAGLSFKEKHAEKIEYLGKYIECTHIQDYGHKLDLHLPPFLGDNDWGALMKALKNTGYKGNLVFEMVHGVMPQNMQKPFADYMMETVIALDKLMEE